MLERLAERGRAACEERAQARADAVAQALAEAAPAGIRVERVAEGVALSGRGLRRRFALDAGIRWLMERVR